MDKIPREICLRCGGAMEPAKRDGIQIGRTGRIFSSLGNLFSGSLDVEIYICSACGKIELYTAVTERAALLQDAPNSKEIYCPNCGTAYFSPLSPCPACGYRLAPGRAREQEEAGSTKARGRPGRKKREPDLQF